MKEAKMIPISPDVRHLIGDWAESVENRGLLHEKFALPKVWGAGEERKLNDAARWSVLRIVSRGTELLRKDADRLRREAAGRNVSPHVRTRKEQDARIAQNMAKITGFESVPVKSANDNAARFLADLQKSFGDRVATFEATLGARLMVNLAGGVVENAGICLDRCFGLPFIQGSALKGVARNQALWEIHQADPEAQPRLLKLAMLVFGYGANDITNHGDFAWAGSPKLARSLAQEIGSADFKGCVCFLPAYPTTPPRLVLDMVNSHYPEYYGGRRNHAEDNENPIPNYFPAVEAGSAFGFAVLLNSVPKDTGVTPDALISQAKQWLQRALLRKGVGAKTAAGYGWFELGRRTHSADSQPALTASGMSPAPNVSTAPVSPADSLILKWRGKLSATGNFPAALPEIAALAEDSDLKRVFEAVIPEQERRRNRKNNPYWQSFTSGRHAQAGKTILSRLNFKLI